MCNNIFPLVSVIVPIYKTEVYLRECVESILAQTYFNLDIILVDDGSPDRCPSICDEYASFDSRIRVVHKKNGGLSDARNAGLNIAAGKWVVFVDSDDVIAQNMIKTLVDACPDDNTATAIGFSRFNNGDQPLYASSSAVVSCADVRTFTRYRKGMFAWGMLYNRALIEQHHLQFDTSLKNLEDVAWNFLYLNYIKTMYYVPSELYYYRKNPTSITSRCCDKHWQVQSWFMARNSVFQWFSGEKRTIASSSILYAAYRYCTNNIFAECIVGKLTYKDYATLHIIPPAAASDVPELVLERLFPQLHFAVYCGLMKLHNLLHR